MPVKRLLIMLSFLAPLLLSGCSSNTNEPQRPTPVKEEIIYSSSFEKVDDTFNWKGTDFSIKEEAAPGCGNRSMRIAGGCLMPHAWMIINPDTCDRYIITRFWGKMDPATGWLKVGSAGSPRFEIYGVVRDSVWTRYQTDTLRVPAYRNFEIWIISGGSAGIGGILIDKLEVVRVK